MVPQQVERQFTVTVNKPVTEERTVSYTDYEPQTVTREVRVPVTTNVTREIGGRVSPAGGKILNGQPTPDGQAPRLPPEGQVPVPPSENR
jgi:hypothetical protein